MSQIGIFKRWIFVFLFVFTDNSLFSQSVNLSTSIQGFETGMTLSAGLYKMYASSYIYLQQKGSTPIFNPQNESYIYKWLFVRLVVPRYLLVQATVYPTAALSSALETYHPTYFKKCEFQNWNVLRAVSSGSEEPYAFSVLLGNVAFMGYRETEDGNKTRLRQSGSALAGFLITAGWSHIVDNIQLDDRWWQTEMILTGNLNKKNFTKINWNFRIGAKFHEHRFIHDVVMLSLYRSHTEWTYRGFSLLRNSIFQYEAHFPIRNDGQKSRFTVRQLLTYGKKFPFQIMGRFIAVRIGGGVLWEHVRKYDHERREFYPYNKSQLIWLIQPSVEF